jgi:hypothetical protein
LVYHRLLNAILEWPESLPYTLSSIAEGYPNGKEAVLKTAERKLLQVRVLSPPPIHSKESPVFFVGMTGAVGQAVLLFHNLVYRYPYKMMSNPSDRFYEGIAYVGLVLAPLAAAFAGAILLRRTPYSIAAVACLSCPLIFLLVFAVAHPILGVEMGNTANFDHTTPLRLSWSSRSEHSNCL